MISIEGLKLENVIGVKNGLDLDKLKITIDPSYLFTLIVGANGSGKSTISNSLNVFATETIIPNKNGKKILKVRDGDTLYKIKHIYTATKKSHTVKSFISDITNKDDIKELNPTGLVSSFKEVIENIFSITTESIQLLTMGRDLANIISMTPTERKNFISKFIKSANEYIQMHKVIRDKRNYVNKHLKNTTLKLDSLTNIESLKIKKEMLETSRLNNNKLIDSLKIEKGIKTNNLTSFTVDENIIVEANNKRSNINKNLSKLDGYNTEELENLNKYEIEKDIALLSQEKSTIDETILNINKALYELQEDIDSQEIELEACDNSKSSDDLDTLIDIKKKLETELSNPCLQQSLLLYKEKYSNLNAPSLKLFIDRLKSIDNSIDLSSIELTILDYCKDRDIDTLRHDAILWKEKLQDLEHKKHMAELDLSKKSTIEESVRILDKRPANCTNNDCQFIKQALQQQSLLSSFNVNIDTILEYNKEIENIKNNILSGIDTIIKIKQSLISLASEYNLHFINDQITVEQMFNNKIKFGTIVDMDNIDKIYSVVEINEEYVTKVNNLNSVKIEIIDVSEIVQLKNTIDSLHRQVCAKDAELLELKTNYNVITDKINEKERILELIEILYSKSELEHDLEIVDKEIDSINSDIEQAKEINREIKEIDYKIHELSYKNDNINKELEKIASEIFTFESLSNRKTLYSNILNKLVPIETALSIKDNGIPLKLTDGLVNETRVIANGIIGSMFPELKLGKFIIDDKSFQIPLEGKGEGTEDVCEASAGEKAIVSVALGLALAKYAGVRYNVICIDEVDGPLDKQNRSMFLSFLEEQAVRFKISQIIVISHNDMYDNVPANIIKLKGAIVDNMDVKNVLFDYGA